MIGLEYASFSKQKCIALQLDLDKDYDRLSWLFLEKTMMKLGFGSCMAKAISNLGRGGISEVCFNTKVVGSF